MKKLIIILAMLPILAFGQVEKFQSLYIYNIGSYCEWPAEYKSGNFIIGVLGSSALVTELNGIAATKKVLGQTIEVKSYGSAGDIGKCHILFVSKQQNSNIGAAVGKTSSNATLIITESPGGIPAGSSFNFVFIEGKLSFEIKPSVANASGIKINPNLEKLAYKVHK